MEVQKMKHVCKFCKKIFPCGRSLGGHIRSHLPKPGYELRENPKKTWRVANDQEEDDHHHHLPLNSTTLSSSSTEIENPKINHNQGKRSNFGRNNSHSSVSEVVEAEHQQEEEEVVVAMCLIMLSKDVGSWGNFSSSFTESSENNNGKKSNNKSRRRRRMREKVVQGNVSVSVATNGKKFESSACGYLQKGLKLKGIEVSANGFCSNEKKNKCFESKRKREKVDDEDHAVKKSAKVESAASGYGKNGAKINEFGVLENGFVSNDQNINNQTPESKRKMIGQSSASEKNVKKWSNLDEFEASENGFSSFDQNISNNKNELDSELCKKTSDLLKRSKFECTTCNKVFHSYQALGGHRASHKKLMGSGKCSPMTLPKLEAEIEDFDNEAATEEVQQQTQSQQKEEEEVTPNTMVIGSSSSSISSKKAVSKHECPICYRVFPSGQALGGHKRSHLLVSSSSSNAEITDRKSEGKKMINCQNRDFVERLSSSETRDHLLDLNFPPAQDEAAITTVSSSNSLVGFMKPYWCVESSHKHEQLLGLISN